MTDIGSVEAPIVEKNTRLGEVMYGLVGSITSDNLIRAHKPKISFREFKLNETQKRSIAFIKENSYPSQMIDIVFNNPPPVFVDQAIVPETPATELPLVQMLREKGMTDGDIRNMGYTIPDMSVESVSFIKPEKKSIIIKPTDRDVKLSEMETLIPEGLDKTATEYLEMFVKNCKTYMATPRVRDGFGFTKEDHANRRLWEEGVMDVFYIIDKEWGNAFKNAVDNNRYSKNRRTTLVSFPPYFRDVALPAPLREKINSMEKRFNLAQEQATAGKADRAANILSAECARFIRFLSKPIRTKQQILSLSPKVV